MLLHKLGTWAVVLGLALPVWAAEQPGVISGYVRSASGVPQMGAVVEILGSSVHSFTVFTNGAGFYSAAGLLLGVYRVKASAASVLPGLRPHVGLRPGCSIDTHSTMY